MMILKVSRFAVRRDEMLPKSAECSLSNYFKLSCLLTELSTYPPDNFDNYSISLTLPQYLLVSIAYVLKPTLYLWPLSISIGVL
jgi:hypothetical protein